MAGPVDVIEPAAPSRTPGHRQAGPNPAPVTPPEVPPPDAGPLATIAFEGPLGRMVIEADGLGLRALRWGEAAAIAFPGEPAEEATAPLILVEARNQVRAYFGGRLRRFSLPLAPRGTRYQRAVWGFINEIPFGVTLTYGELAALVPGGPRAAARACATNPLPLIIPCHRVVGATGEGGYSAPGGVETKRFLLGLEGVGARRRRLGLIPPQPGRAARPQAEFWPPK